MTPPAGTHDPDEAAAFDAILTAIKGVQTRVDDVHSRMGEMVTRAEHAAEMRQVNGRLDRVQQSVADERIERVEQVRQERTERQEEIREERTARLEAEAATRTKTQKILSITLAGMTLAFTVITYILDRISIR